MHELIILGFLFKNELHGYQIKQKVDQLLAGIFSLSDGSLYPTLKRLELQNYITSKTSISDGGQEKIMYTLTDKGKEYFFTLMETSPKEKFQAMWLRFQIKLLFFGYLDSKIIKNLQQEIIKQIKIEITKLEKEKGENNSTEYAQILINKSLEDLKRNLIWVETLKNK